MILLDTNIIIDYWHDAAPVVADVMRREDVCVCGPVLAELMHGADHEQELEEIESLVSALPQLEIDEQVWHELGRNLYAMRKAGVAVPFQDALLATVAVVNGLELWTNDGHFEMMQRALKGLRLFSPNRPSGSQQESAGSGG